MASHYTPRYTLVNKARAANPEPSSPPSSRSPSPPSSRSPSPPSSRSPSPPSSHSTPPSQSAWQTSHKPWDPPSRRPHSRASSATTWRRGSDTPQTSPTPPPSPPSPPPSPPSPPPSPPRRQRALTGDWRSSATTRPTCPEWIAGRVVLLPAESQVPASSIVHGEVSGAPWNHPAVITQTLEANGTKLVKLRICTSFGGQGLARKQERHHRYFVEADKTHLTADSDEFFKKTWVNCSPGSEITIELEHLGVQTGKYKGDIQFSQAALDEFHKNEHTRKDSAF
ncbi:hypothetical protein OPT61_g1591 [Boeremia exigua]|uniref:Uncharacterized protein n=1 Tax=Boeremia exigua TaxID=749465 RepID=A0ACC2IPJ1_9PLEO|nr:hypothetical protein OPT61_g1591 [Boeremia exigua]